MKSIQKIHLVVRDSATQEHVRLLVNEVCGLTGAFDLAGDIAFANLKLDPYNGNFIVTVEKTLEEKQ